MPISGFLPRDVVSLRSECAICYEAADHPDLVPWEARTGQTITLDRNSLAMGLAGDGTEYQVVAHQHRFKAVDSDGDGVLDCPARLIEPVRTNAWTFSRDLSNAAWTKLNSGTTALSSVLYGPDGATFAYKVQEGTTTNVVHGIERNTGTLADNVRSVVSFAAFQAERQWLYVETTTKSGAVGRTWINLATGAVGTKSGNHNVTVEARRSQFGQTWWRIAVSFPNNSGATTPKIVIATATADNQTTHVGVVGQGVYLTDLQIEIDVAWPTSFIPTAGATVQRVGERWKGTLDWSAGWPNDVSAYVRFLRPPFMDHTGNTGQFGYLLAIGCQGSGQRLGIYLTADTKLAFAFAEGPSTISTQSIAIPSTSVIELAANFRNLLTAPQARLDVGSGFTAYATAATPMTVPVNTTFSIGDLDGSNGQSGTPILSVRVVRDVLYTLAQLQAVR